MDPIKVVVLTPGSFPVPSGRRTSVETVVLEQARWLKDQVNLTIIGKKTAEQPESECVDGLRFIRVRRRGGRYDWRELCECLRRIRPDVIQVENRPNYLPPLSGLLSRLRPRPALWLSLHSLKFVSPPHITRRELQRSFRLADRIVANSGFLARRLSRLAPEARPILSVNHPGVNPDVFVSRWTPVGAALRESFLHSLGYDGKKIILYAGRLIPQKGVHHVLEAMSRVAERHPDAVLLVVGSAKYGQNPLTPYVRRLHQLGNRMPNNVRFIPFQPHDQMARWFRLADVVVVPSPQDEAFGLVNVEAMACGAPVLAARSGGMKEIIRHGETGYLLDPDRLQEELFRSLDRLLGDPDSLAAMGKRCAEDARSRFTWRQSADRLLALYQAERKRRAEQ